MAAKKTPAETPAETPAKTPVKAEPSEYMLVTRERGRVHRANVKAATTQQIRLAAAHESNAEQREAVKQSGILSTHRALNAERAQSAAQNRAAAEMREAAERRRQLRQSAIGAGVGSLGSDSGGGGGGGGGGGISAPTSDGNIVMTVIFMIAGLSFMYYMVTHADQFGGFAATIGDTLHKISSTTPLFAASSTK